MNKYLYIKNNLITENYDDMQDSWNTAIEFSMFKSQIDYDAISWSKYCNINKQAIDIVNAQPQAIFVQRKQHRKTMSPTQWDQKTVVTNITADMQAIRQQAIFTLRDQHLKSHQHNVTKRMLSPTSLYRCKQFYTLDWAPTIIWGK